MTKHTATAATKPGDSILYYGETVVVDEVVRVSAKTIRIFVKAANGHLSGFDIRNEWRRR